MLNHKSGTPCILMFSNLHVVNRIVRPTVGRGGALVESMTFDLRVAGSNPALAARRDLGQVFHLQLPVALRRISSDTVSIAVVGSASERLML